MIFDSNGKKRRPSLIRPTNELDGVVVSGPQQAVAPGQFNAPSGGGVPNKIQVPQIGPNEAAPLQQRPGLTRPPVVDESAQTEMAAPPSQPVARPNLIRPSADAIPSQQVNPPEQPVMDRTASRPRLVRPVDPVLKAKENLQESYTRPLYSNVEGDQKKPNRVVAAIQEFLAGVGPGMANAQANARAERRGFGPGDFAAGLAAGGGAAVGGAIDPTMPLKRQRQAEIAERKGLLNDAIGIRGADLEIEKTRGEIDGRRVDSEYKGAQIARADRDASREEKERTRADVIKIYNDLPEFDPNSDDPYIKDLVKLGKSVKLPLPKKSKDQRISMHVTPDGRVLLHDGNGNVREAMDGNTGQAFSVGRADSVDLPKSFYRSADVDDESAAESLTAIGAPAIRPEILQTYGNDVARIQSAIRMGRLSPGQVFTDPTKSAEYERNVASIKARKGREAQEFNRALDTTSRSKSAHQVSYADFERMYAQFQSDYQGAKTDQERQGLRNEFEGALRQVRVF